MVVGADESGRGPVIGPLIICGVQFDRKGVEELKRMKVRDSKLLSPKRREELAPKIRSAARGVKMIIFEAREIDKLRETKSLNQIELEAFAEIIRSLGDDEVIVDLPEPGRRWVAILRTKIPKNVKLTAEHKADMKYPIVGAASILAKVERDRRIRELEKEIGMEIGSGYPRDPHTLNFLRKWIAAHKEIPPWVRMSWRTARELWGIKKQKKLSAYRKKKQKSLGEY